MPIPRKILIRVIGAPLLLAALGAILYADHLRATNGGLILLLAVVSAVSSIEFHGFCAARGIATAKWVGTICVVALFLPWSLKPFLNDADPFDPASACLAVALLFLLYVLLKLVFRNATFTPEAAGYSFLGFAYVGLLAVLPAMPVQAKDSIYYLLFLVATGKGSDMAAFVTGKTIGRHKMAPVVSPNKTWEGCIGGAIAGTAAGTYLLVATPLGQVYPGVPVPALLGFAFLVTMAGQLGDLVKSVFKRWAGVKDSGRLLPEFGGMLDMVDSFLVSIPVAHLAGAGLLLLF